MSNRSRSLALALLLIGGCKTADPVGDHADAAVPDAAVAIDAAAPVADAEVTVADAAELPLCAGAPTLDAAPDSYYPEHVRWGQAATFCLSGTNLACKGAHVTLGGGGNFLQAPVSQVSIDQCPSGAVAVFESVAAGPDATWLGECGSGANTDGAFSQTLTVTTPIGIATTEELLIAICPPIDG